MYIHLIKYSRLPKCSLDAWILFVILTVGLFDLAVLEAAAAVSVSSFSKPDVTHQAAVRAAYGKRPLSFEFNRGHTGGQVKSLSWDNDYSLFLTCKEAVLVSRTPEGRQERTKHKKSKKTKAKEAGSKVLNTDHSTVVRKQLVGTNSAWFSGLRGQVLY